MSGDLSARLSSSRPKQRVTEDTPADSPMTKHDMKATLEALVAFPAQLKAHFYSFPTSHQNWRPSSWDGIPSERLTAIEQLCHVKDVEIEGYQERFRRTRTEHNPVLPDLPGELMAQERRYVSADATRVLAEFADARVATVAAIRAFSDTELGRVATFEGKTTTLAGLVHLLCSHDCQHLSGLQWLLAKIEGAKRPDCR
jgi:hypothetical protein